MKTLLLLVMVLGMGFFAVNAEAFCIYNRTNDIVIKVKQTGGGADPSQLVGFKAKINPGEKACCNWKNKDCNKEGNRDSTVVFNVEKKSQENKNICIITIPAGGYAKVKGKNGVYWSEGHGY